MPHTITHEQIIAQARTWKDTKFQHQGRLKKYPGCKGGVDCIGLVVGVIGELKMRDATGKLLIDYDDTSYSFTPDGYTLKATLDAHLQPIEKPKENIRPGDIPLMRFNKNPQHVGFITDRDDGALGIIHCYSNSEKVVEHILDDKWRDLIVAAYRFRPEHLNINE